MAVNRYDKSGVWRGIWSRRGALALLLWPLSRLYALAWAVRASCYRLGLFRVTRVSVPVLVVGNVAVGGAGKTPVVMELVRHLLGRGYRVGVVSRGHGRRDRTCLEVQAGDSAERCGDEPLLIKRALAVPVFVAKDRAQAAVSLLRQHPTIDVIVSDDGLQHIGLARDLEICLLDETGLGNGLLLPAGPLREPWPRPADWVLNSSRHPAPGQFRVERRLADEAKRSDGSSVALDTLRGKRLLAIAAIAHPESFFAMLRERGLDLARTIALPDHDDFGAFQWPAEDAFELVFTEKDATKIWALHSRGWAVPLRISLDPDFLSALDERLDRLSLRRETRSNA